MHCEYAVLIVWFYCAVNKFLCMSVFGRIEDFDGVKKDIIGRSKLKWVIVAI